MIKNKYPKSLTNIKYPKFIRNHKEIIFWNKKGIAKKFDLVGLKEFSKKYTHPLKIKKSELIDLINKSISNIINSNANLKYKNVNEKNRKEFKGSFLKTNLSIFKKIVLPFDIKTAGSDMYTSYSFKKGTTVLNFINKIIRNHYYKNYNFSLLQLTLNSIIDYELSNADNLKIVFSTHPWDIATMSMRGISSCQSWTHQYSSHLIGSILDPYCGIIYITNGGNTKYGSKMLVRSIVRVVAKNKNAVDSNLNKHKLLIESPYVFNNKGYVKNDIFINYFKKEGKNNFCEKEQERFYYIAMSEQINRLKYGDELSYLDGNMHYDYNWS